MAAFNSRTTAEQASAGVDLTGRHAIVTGANTGIGLETARVLALRGCKVTMACRNLEKAEAARQRILSGNPALSDDALRVQRLDLASLEQVRVFAKAFLGAGLPLDLLIANAGVMQSALERTADGFEIHLGINHLGHFLLTNLLLEKLCTSAPARVVVVSSEAQHFASISRDLEDLNWDKKKYSGMRAYGNSKLMNTLFANELFRRVQHRGVVANSLHPGIVLTELGRNQAWYMQLFGLLLRPMMKQPDRGAATSVMLATQPEYGGRGGGYYADCAPAKRQHHLSGDRAVEEDLWGWSELAVGLTSFAR
jgi:NAD(P)-dependent dehydrogenase (short-subunit alcohol dehydrogenase family)